MRVARLQGEATLDVFLDDLPPAVGGFAGADEAVLGGLEPFVFGLETAVGREHGRAPDRDEELAAEGLRFGFVSHCVLLGPRPQALAFECGHGDELPAFEQPVHVDDGL